VSNSILSPFIGYANIELVSVGKHLREGFLATIVSKVLDFQWKCWWVNHGRYIVCFAEAELLVEAQRISFVSLLCCFLLYPCTYSI